MTIQHPEGLAQHFAQALDRCDFQAAGRDLAPDCLYFTGREVLTGPLAILDSYSQNARWAEEALQQVVYESRVQLEPDGSIIICFTDRISHGGRTHQYRCNQRLFLNGEGKIARIVQEELPGERRKLNKFLAKCGIRR